MVRGQPGTANGRAKHCLVTGPACGRPAECRTGTGTDGFVKLVFRGDDRQLLRATSLELIYLGQSVMHAGDTIDRFINTRFAVRTRTDFYKDPAFDRAQRPADRTLEGLCAPLRFRLHRPRHERAAC
jgi:hypothetical protein